MNKKQYFPLITLVLIILITTVSSGFHLNYETFIVVKNSGNIKSISQSESVVDGATTITYIKKSPAPAPAPIKSPASAPSPSPISLLQPAQSRMDYLNVSTNAPFYPQSINNLPIQQPLSTSSTTQQPLSTSSTIQQPLSTSSTSSTDTGFYNQAVNFFSS